MAMCNGKECQAESTARPKGLKERECGAMLRKCREAMVAGRVT